MADDNPTMSPLHKLPKFSTEEEALDVDDFIQEVRLVLQLKLLDDVSAALWLLSTLQGRVHQEIVRRPATEVESPEKILTIIEENWGDPFFTRQQGPGETVVDYASHLRMLWTKVNKAEEGMLPTAILSNAFANGLQLPALRRDVRRYIRDHPDITFEGAKKEAQRWMQEDNNPSSNASGTGNSATVACLQAQLATLTAEIASLKDQLRRCSIPKHPLHPSGSKFHIQSCTADQPKPDPKPPDCHWCERWGSHRGSVSQQTAQPQAASPATGYDNLEEAPQTCWCPQPEGQG
ncbi:hypothetical protein ACOMHN_032710 [Nucella lapillus]